MGKAVSRGNITSRSCLAFLKEGPRAGSHLAAVGVLAFEKTINLGRWQKN